MTDIKKAEVELQTISIEPRVDIYEDAKAVTLLADLPGVGEKDIDLTLDKDVLSIHATASHTGGREVKYEYTRSFTMTDRVDRAGIKAAVKDGVLTLTFPITEEAKARKIPISYN